MSDFYKQIIENNRNWVAKMLKEDADFFNKLADG